MSNADTKRMITAYLQQRAPTMFFAGFFQSPPENFHTSETVEIDIERGQEDVAIVIQDLSAGTRRNATDIFTNKEFTPPIYDEEVAINSFDLLKRNAGDNPFENVDFRGALTTRVLRGVRQIENKINRSKELQASQVMQTGKLVLTDKDGVPLYSLDYKPKATHFPTSAIAWNAGGATIAEDINALAEVIRTDGLADPDQVIMGVNAFEAFIADDEIQKRFDNRRMELGRIVPMEMRGQGGIFRGVVEVGNYSYDVWTYGGRFTDPQTGLAVQFMDPGKCVVRASAGRMDATFGAVPNIGTMLGQMGNNILPELPGRISGSAGGVDLFTNAYLSENGKQLFAGVASRPLYIPTAIDTYGCIDTGTG